MVESACVICGGDFKARGPKKTCSSDCAKQLAKNTKAKWHRNAYNSQLSSKPCKGCGKVGVLLPKHQFCGDSCRYNHLLKKLRKATVVNCVECGHSFMQRRGDEVRCSKRCRQISTSRHGYNNPKPSVRYELKRQLGIDPPDDLLEEMTALRILNRVIKNMD